MPATFWLFWHMMRDHSLLAQATSEANACRTYDSTEPLCFDTTKLCNQPLLQSSYAETLRMYVAVYIIRKPEYEDAQVLDYKIPKDKMIVVSSAMAHMDKRNWNLGVMEEHPVETFWAGRFLSHSDNTHRSPSVSSGNKTYCTSSRPNSTRLLSEISNPSPSEPRFSLNGYSGAWVPFGGGIHQCPGRHWVKLQMLLSFAIINANFDIEFLDGERKLRVDMAKYGLGALQPAEKARFRIKRKKTSVQSKR